MTLISGVSVYVSIMNIIVLYYTIIDFNFGRHKDLSIRQNYIHRGRKAEVNIILEGR